MRSTEWHPALHRPESTGGVLYTTYEPELRICVDVHYDENGNPERILTEESDEALGKMVRKALWDFAESDKGRAEIFEDLSNGGA